jgi:hypothetical protein
MSGVLPGVSFIRNMPQALGLKKDYPNRQVISLSGDGGLAMLRGDLWYEVTPCYWLTSVRGLASVLSVNQ